MTRCIEKIIAAIVALTVLSGCFYDKKAELFPADGLFSPCDSTSTMTYSGHVAPILSSYCYSCHSGPTPSANVSLDNYTSVSAYAASGQLLGTLKHIAPYSQMPPSAPLDHCKIKQIELWVNAGAPNN